MLEKVQPELVVLDLPFPGGAWLEQLRRLNSSYPLFKILVTNFTQTPTSTFTQVPTSTFTPNLYPYPYPPYDTPTPRGYP